MKRQQRERKDTPLCQKSKLEPMEKNNVFCLYVPGVGTVLCVLTIYFNLNKHTFNKILLQLL